MNKKVKYITNFCVFGLVLMLADFPTQMQAQDNQEDEVIFQYVDPLIKVFRNTAEFPKSEARADVARGEHATFQFVVRSGHHLRDVKVSVEALKSDSDQLDEVKVGYLGYVHVGNLAMRQSAYDRLRPNSGYYPDPILENPPESIKAGTAQPVWLTVPIPERATPGDYQAKVVLTARVHGEPIRIERSITVRIYPPVVEDTRLWVTNWWVGRYPAASGGLRYMNGGEHVEPFSTRYWKLVRSIAGTMADYRQNVALLDPLRLAQYEVENGRYHIDFSRFDHMAKLFIEEDVIGRIEGGHLATRSADGFVDDSEFHVFVPEVSADTTIFKKHPISEERARSFYRQYISALVRHLKEKGWYDIYMQHIADEPTKGNADSYLAIARFVKKLAPNFKLIEATLSKSLEEKLDVWTPTLDGLHKNYEFFKKRAKAGDEIWFYTCVVPQGDYANRFLELPLIKTRLLHWINFRYDATGYLHWGFNYWNGDPLEGFSRMLPGGDPWIVYPGEGGVIPSIRLEAMRHGIVDHELLSMLEEQRPEEAKKIVRRVVLNFDRYNAYVPAFRETRRLLLELLSETSVAEQD